MVDETEQQFIIGKNLPDFESLSDEWKKKILSTNVFARTTPKQKLDIVAVKNLANPTSEVK